MKKTVLALAVIIMGLSLAACSTSPETPTATAAPTNTPAPTATETPVPTPTPEPIGGGTGEILYLGMVQEEADLGNGTTLSYPVYQLEKMDLESGETEILITLDMLEEELGMELYQSRFKPSPDGSQVVISVATAISKDGPESYENYLATLDLNSLIPILDAGATYVDWIWSPDGSKLVGDTLIDGSRGILIVNNDGSGLQKVIKSSSAPIWGANSDKIYTLLLGKPIETDLEGNESQPVGFENIEGSLLKMSFSPDGQRVAYITEAGEVFLANSDFSEKQQVDIESKYKTCIGDYYPSFPEWSPNSAEVIFRDVQCMAFFGLSTTDYLVRVDDGEILSEVSFSFGNGRYFCGWSPNGQLVRYLDTSEEYKLRLLPDPGTDNPAWIDLEIDYPSTLCPTWIQ